jgi:hypothetical protein
MANDARHGFELSRRDLLRCFSVAAGTQAPAPRPASGTGEEYAEGRYRVDATILLLGVPVFRRNNVGEARIALRQHRQGDARHIELLFAAFSDAARSHGLDRRGWLREVIEEDNSSARRAAVLGIMSESPEQSAAEARQALHAASAAPRYVAIDGLNLPGRTRSRVAHFQGGTGLSPLDDEMAALARASFDSPAPPWRETAWPDLEDGIAPSTFLYAILRALERGLPATQSGYVYNEDRYHLRLETVRRDSAGSARCARVVVRNLTRALPPAQFRVWHDSSGNSRLPLRVELQPRSFLRLTLERRLLRPTPPAKDN